MRRGLIALIPLLMILAACGAGDGASRGRPIRRDAPGYTLYQRLICHRCHGGDLGGTAKAPSLRGLAQHYDAGRLSQYLQDPGRLQDSDPRLRELTQRYTQFEMPSYTAVDTLTRNTLVEFLLDPWLPEDP